MRPDVGTQAAFKKKKPPVTYRYDSSLSPALDWDGQNPAREQGEAILAELGRQLAEIRAALEDPRLETVSATVVRAASRVLGLLDRLKAMSRPFLNWAGKAERLSFDVPTLPLFVHERLSTKAIIETLHGHRREPRRAPCSTSSATRSTRSPTRCSGLRVPGRLGQPHDPGRFAGGDELAAALREPGRPGADDLHGPALRREVRHQLPALRAQARRQTGDDDDMTREPEMVQAYRDTWELGLHSYLTYMRDRLLLAREPACAERERFRADQR